MKQALQPILQPTSSCVEHLTTDELTLLSPRLNDAGPTCGGMLAVSPILV